MRVFVTGSAGFVGGHLTGALRAAGHEVIGRDRELDVARGEELARTVARVEPEALVHLAAQSSVASSLRNTASTYRVNYLGSRNLLAAAARCVPEARVLLVSSSDVYGPAGEDRDISEDTPLRPATPYARTKACADLLGAEYARRGLDVVRARPFSHVGPGQSDAFALPSFARQALEIASGRREPILRVGNLDSVRDLLDVEDVVRAYLRLLDRAVPAGVYNIASGTGRRIGDLLDGLLDRVGVSPRIEVDAQRHRPADRAVGDASKLRAVTGWEPRIPISRTLDRIIADWRSRLADA